MGEFNSDDHDIYYCGQESFRRNGVAIIVKKRAKLKKKKKDRKKKEKSPKYSTWMQSQK